MKETNGYVKKIINDIIMKLNEPELQLNFLPHLQQTIPELIELKVK